MRRLRGSALVGAVMLAALLDACSPAIPPQQNYATIYGTVYDGASGQPLSGATVTVDAVLTASTASDGTYTVPNVPIGPFTAVESANGYQQHQDQGSVAAGDRFLLNATLYK